jgi:biopolymer transport protein ExbD
MPSFKKNIPELNTTSTADIAFILLLFFLITGSLDPKSGIYRHLSPATSEVLLKKKTDIEKRNLLTFTIDENNEIRLDETPVALSEIRNIALIFISNPENLDYLSEKELLDIPELGVIPVSGKAVISMEISREASYQTYISVLSELTAAYETLRNKLAYDKFQQRFNDLTEDQKAAIRTVYPQQIVEKELPGKEIRHE